MNKQYGTTVIMLGLIAVLGQAARGAEDMAALAQILTSPQATVEQKHQICERLQLSGTPAIVPALATMLVDDELSHSARLALEGMPFREAAEALRSGVAKTKGNTRAGIIDSLGDRRERESVAVIAPFAADADPVVASSAALALGKIGGAEAVAALRAAWPKAAPAVQAAIADGLLLCADSLRTGGDAAGASAIYREVHGQHKEERIRTAACRGLILAGGADAAKLMVDALKGEDVADALAAVQLAADIKGEAITAALAKLLPGLRPAVQTALLEALARRGDAAAVPAIASVVSSSDPQVRAAALTALGSLADSSVALLLARQAARSSGAEQEAARESLALLKDDRVREVLLAGMAGAPEAVQGEIVRALAQRQEVKAVPALISMAEGSDGAVRLPALRALAVLADGAQQKDLIRLLVNARDNAERVAAEQALVAGCSRSARPEALVPGLLETKAADLAVRAALLRTAGRLGGPQAVQALRSAMKDADQAIQETALRTMSEYSSIEAMPDLLNLANDAQRSMPHRVLALRGYWRLVGLAGDRPAEERVRMCEAGLAAAQRPEEKRLGLSELSKVPHAAALKLAGSLASAESTRDEAEAASVRIAAMLSGAQPAEARSALRRLQNEARSEATRAEARKTLETLDQYVGYVTTWSVAGPYRQAGKSCTELFDIPFAPEQGGQGVTWKTLPPPADRSLFWQADLLPIADGDQCVAYLRSRIYSPAQQKVRLEIGSDDGNRVWVNGTIVHANNTMRPIQAGTDKAEAVLKEGWNDLLVKVTQNNQGFAFCVRLRAPDGSVIDGIRFDTGGK